MAMWGWFPRMRGVVSSALMPGQRSIQHDHVRPAPADGGGDGFAGCCLAHETAPVE